MNAEQERVHRQGSRRPVGRAALRQYPIAEIVRGLSKPAGGDGVPCRNESHIGRTDNDADLAPFRLQRAGNEQLEHRAGPKPLRSKARPAVPSAGSVTFCVLTAPSCPTHAQRLATAIEEEVTAMPNAPDCGQRVMIE